MHSHLKGKTVLDKALNEFFGQDKKREEDYRDFERRHQENPDQVSDQEAAQRYREMMGQMDDQDEDEEVQQEYERAFSNLSPEERRDLARRYLEATEDSGRSYQGYDKGKDVEQASSPRDLGRMTRRAAKQDPDLLEQLMGKNSPLNSRGGKMALAGLAAFAAKRFLGNKR